MTDGTTLCPHCATRFRIGAAQLSAYSGMVRCGHCRQAFDARPNYLPDQPSPQLDLPIDDDDAAVKGDIVTVAEQPDTASFENGEIPEPARPTTPEPGDATTCPVEHAATCTPESQLEPISYLDESRSQEPEHAQLLLAAPVSDAAPNSSSPDGALTEATVKLTDGDTRNAENGLTTSADEPAPDTRHGDATNKPLSEAHAKCPVWPWITGIALMIILLVAQSAYFFRVGLAARMPALKPALVGYCQLLGCGVPLPQNAELMSIESSGLNADADHENRVNLDALLRNRASYTLAFPVLSLTLNDTDDKPLARRIFLPADYLARDRPESPGLRAGDEVSILLHMDTAELRPVGYRLELYYPK